MNNSKETSAERLRKLYPELSEEEFRIANDNFRRYVAFALRVYEAIRTDPARYAKFKALTAKRRIGKLKSKSTQPTDFKHT